MKRTITLLISLLLVPLFAQATPEQMLANCMQSFYNAAEEAQQLNPNNIQAKHTCAFALDAYLQLANPTFMAAQDPQNKNKLTEAIIRTIQAL